MKKILVRVGLVVVIVLVVAVVAVGFFLGSILKKGVETVGPTLTKTELKLDGASLSLLSGSGGLQGLLVGNPEGYKTPSAIKAGSVSLGVKPLSVFSDKVHVTHVRMVAPQITFEGNLSGNNLSKILENVQAATGGAGTDKSKPEAKGASKKLQVDEVTITDGKIHLSIAGTGGKPVTLPLPSIRIENLGQGPEGITAADLANKMFGSITVNTLKAVGQSGIDLGKQAVDTAAGAVKDAAKGASEGVKGATKSIGDLFKKN